MMSITATTSDIFTSLSSFTSACGQEAVPAIWLMTATTSEMSTVLSSFTSPFSHGYESGAITTFLANSLPDFTKLAVFVNNF